MRMNTESDAQEFGTVVPKMDEQTRLLFAGKVKAARQNAGRTQEDVAAAAGVSRNTVRDMESGAKVPQTEKLWRVMLELDIPTDDREPEWVRAWWSAIRPIAERVPESRRWDTLGKILVLLHEEASAK